MAFPSSGARARRLRGAGGIELVMGVTLLARGRPRHAPTEQRRGGAFIHFDEPLSGFGPDLVVWREHRSEG